LMLTTYVAHLDARLDALRGELLRLLADFRLELVLGAQIVASSPAR
jgi:hypothetical protein